MNRLDCDVVTYYSINAKPEEAWLAYCVLPKDGSQWLVRFSGATEQAAITKAKAFYAKEKARQDRLYVGSDLDFNDEQPSGKGAMFVGKVWMLNRATGERARVLPAEVADYAAKGFVRSGPRSK